MAWDHKYITIESKDNSKLDYIQKNFCLGRRKNGSGCYIPTMTYDRGYIVTNKWFEDNKDLLQYACKKCKVKLIVSDYNKEDE